MIDSLLNLIFRCSHQRLTRPLTPVNRRDTPNVDTYVVCLDCGKQFEYDLKEMRLGKVIDSSHQSSVVPKETPNAKTKMKFAVAAAAPVAAVVLGTFLNAKHASQTKKTGGVRAGDPGEEPMGK